MKTWSLSAALIFGAFAPAGAFAEPSAEDIIAACRNDSATDNERFDCLENAIRALGGVSVASEQEASPPIAPDAPPATAAVAQSAPPAEIAVAPAATGIGAEQVVARREKSTKEGRKQRKERESAEAIVARMIDFAYTSTGRLVIVLDNGQVWAQRAGDQQEVRLREGDQTDVKIRRGALSGYRLELSEPDVTIVAERLQ